MDSDSFQAAEGTARNETGFINNDAIPHMAIALLCRPDYRVL